MRTVNRAGYWSQKQLDADPRIKSRKHHGFDMGKLTPSSLFYLPVSGGEPGRTASSSTTTRPAVSRSIRMSGLAMPPTIIDREPEPSCPARHADRRRTSAAADAADRLPQAPADARDDRGMRKRRRFRTIRRSVRRQRSRSGTTRQPRAAIEAFFQLAVDLRGAGLSMAEIEDALRLEAGNARHPTERRREIKSIMRTLRRIVSPVGCLIVSEIHRSGEGIATSELRPMTIYLWHSGAGFGSDKTPAGRVPAGDDPGMVSENYLRPRATESPKELAPSVESSGGKTLINEAPRRVRDRELARRGR